jgi:hypothetical protein
VSSTAHFYCVGLLLFVYHHTHGFGRPRSFDVAIRIQNQDANAMELFDDDASMVQLADTAAS